MDYFGGGQPPGDDARPYLPTEIDPPFPPGDDARLHPPAEDARPVLPTEIEPPYPPAHAGPAYLPTHTGSGEPAAEFMKFGPGTPASPPAGASQTAERIWRAGRPDEPPRRPRRWRGLAGAALTVILLAASAVVLYMRFHHAPFHVTEVAITQQTQSGCAV
ncbi:MAG TPA: hypothetical protein VIG49_06890, partial [Acetobacteraceae bacterium]